MQIDLTEDEAQSLVTLLDAATKAGGLQAAPAALNIFQKLQEAANSPEETTEELEIS